MLFYTVSLKNSLKTYVTTIFYNICYDRKLIKTYSACLDSNYCGVCVFVLRFFFLFFGSARICLLFNSKQCIRVLFTDQQISFFNNSFIKNRSYGTINTFKNYFAIVFSVSAKISSIQTDP